MTNFTSPIKENVFLNTPSVHANFLDMLHIAKGPDMYLVHMHSEFEILCCVQGEINVSFSNKTEKLYEGDCIFLNSLTPHQTTTLIDNTFCKIIQFDLFNFLTRQRIITDKTFFIPMSNICPYQYKILRKSEATTTELIGIINRNCSKASEKTTSNILSATALLSETIAFLMENGIISNTLDNPAKNMPEKIYLSLQYINQHYHEDIPLDKLCDDLNINKSYFCKVFKITTNYTFSQYLNYFRIVQAEKLLKKTDKSILDIAFEVGFSSVSYFNRIYKKFRQYTPLFYRKYLNK